jgi:hypothetical protein
MAPPIDPCRLPVNFRPTARHPSAPTSSLRTHGKQLCKSSKPRCERCPLNARHVAGTHDYSHKVKNAVIAGCLSIIGCRRLPPEEIDSA